VHCTKISPEFESGGQTKLGQRSRSPKRTKFGIFGNGPRRHGPRGLVCGVCLGKHL